MRVRFEPTIFGYEPDVRSFLCIKLTQHIKKARKNSQVLNSIRQGFSIDSSQKKCKNFRSGKMKKLFLYSVLFLFVFSCAKPTVVNIVLPEDNELNCQQLENAVAESQKIKRDAEYAKEGTGGNVARLLLFWPAWAQTLHNADVAIQAANDRNYHLLNIMKKKNCSGIDKVEAQITNTTISTNSTNNITGQLKELKKMYESGDLTEEEYQKAKKKILE